MCVLRRSVETAVESRLLALANIRDHERAAIDPNPTLVDQGYSSSKADTHSIAVPGLPETAKCLHYRFERTSYIFVIRRYMRVNHYPKFLLQITDFRSATFIWKV